MSVGGGAIQSR